MKRIKVITWNVHETMNCVSGDRFSISPTVDDADVVFIQEAPADLHENSVTHKYTTSWMLEPSMMNRGDKMGLAILSHYPIHECKRVEFANPGWLSTVSGGILTSHPKGALIVDIEFPGGFLRVACVHLLPVGIFQIEEDSKVACNYIADVANQIITDGANPDIIAGDFNNRTRKHFSEMGYVSSAKGSETRTSGDSHDDILLQEPVSLLEFEILPGSSDHHALKADITQK